VSAEVKDLYLPVQILFYLVPCRQVKVSPGD